MYKFECLGSGSKGNCYIIGNEQESLIIECGISFKEVQKAVGFNVRKIVGALVSHVHRDHDLYADSFSKYGIEVFEPFKCEKLTNKPMKFGNFNIIPFPLVHDVPCYGFYITHPEIGSMVYISDTEYCKYKFKNLNHIFVECNYSKDYIGDHVANREHVLTGHMELETCKRFIQANNNDSLISVCLLHLSGVNGDCIRFENEIQTVTNSDVYIARKGTEYYLN